MKNRTVIVLKAESESTDVYAELLQENGFNAVFVPTLSFGFKQLDELRAKLMTPDKYAGLIFTSSRCVEAVRESLGGTNLPDAWKMRQNYAVGEVTHNLALSSLQQLFTQGKQTGNANNLADFIVETFNGTKALPFLLPCGNLRTDTLLSKLLGEGFLLDACEVYETVCHPDFKANFEQALAEENIEYLAFFSPSGVNATCDYLLANNVDINNRKLVAIGPSTRRAMEARGLTVYRTAERPSVECLIKVLINPDDCRPKLSIED